MSNNDYIRTLIGYNYARWQNMWDSIAQLSDAQFVQEVDYSHGSLRNHIVHVAAADGRWLRGLQGDPAARQFNLDPADYPTREQARGAWDAAAQAMQRYVATLSDADLALHPPGFSGPAWHALAHVANHGTDHRAQMLRIVHDFGAPTFEQELITYLWND